MRAAAQGDGSLSNESKNLPSLMNIMIELRKCCNHPFLIRSAEQTILAELRRPAARG